MLTNPIAKINLGLNVVERRPDGYHNLETVFYPVPICDALEVFPMAPQFPSAFDCDLKVTNIHIDGDEQRNLVVRAYNLLKQDFPDLPRIHAHLYKGIPTQAGMGGGSSDCGFMITLLNRQFQLGLSDEQMIAYAARLGADCAFFILNKPCYAEGIGEKLEPIDLQLKGWYLAVVRPDIPVPTKEAFSLITPQRPQKNCRDIVMQPISGNKGSNNPTKSQRNFNYLLILCLFLSYSYLFLVTLQPICKITIRNIYESEQKRSISDDC